MSESSTRSGGPVLSLGHEVGGAVEVEPARPGSRPHVTVELTDLEAAIGAIQDPVWLLDGAGQVLLANAEAQRQPELASLGELPDERAGAHGVLAVKRPDGAAVPWEERPLARALRGDFVQQLELQVLDAAGRERVGLHSTTGLHSSGGRALIKLTVRDITDQRRAEGQALSSGRLLGEMLEVLRDGFFALGRDWCFTYANGRAAENLGCAPGELIGQELWQRFPQIRGTAPEALLRRVMEERVAARQELQGALSDRWYDVRVHPLTDGIAVAWIDISERKRSEQALAASEAALARSAERLGNAHARLRAHMETTPLALVEWDSEYRVKGFSCRAEALFGWSAEEVLGRRIDEIPWVPEADWPLVRTLMRDMASGVRPTSVNANRNLRKDGSLVDCEWYNSSIYDEAGRLVSVLSLVLDVTDRKRAEAALREADRRKDEFLGMLSHELRNPLAPISSSIHILERADPASERAARARGVVRRQTEHLVRLVDDLLDVTRIAQGKIELRLARIDLREVLQNAADDFQFLLGDHGVAFHAALPETPVWVQADAARLTQVVENLLHNAAKFTRAGDRVSISLSAGTETAEVIVADTGQGIEPKLLPRVFEPFVQGEPTLARTQGGLGLGLALVRGLVGLHGGAVRAESDGKGKGARFVVAVPLDSEPLPAPAPAAAGSSARPRRVLVVDDNVDAADSLADFLRMLGHQVEVAYEGQEAIARALATRPEVVLCDIGLPGMSGHAVARALRAGGAEDLVLVALSGYGQPEDRKLALEAGFDRYLTKPASPEALEQLLG